MKHSGLILFSLFTFYFSLVAQKEIVSTATDFIVAKKFTEANRYLDSVLKKNKKNTDALMMKGNVILNHALDTTKPMQFVTEEDESIFTSAISEKPKLLSQTAVFQIEKHWKRCLQIDSSRVDIRKGLCSVYSMALMKDSLKNEIIQLKRVEKDDGEQAYRIAEYARKFKERNHFEDAMELYQFIAKLYPELAGLRSDIASEYFYHGQLKETLIWLDSTFNFTTVDETSFLNGAFTYSELGYFDDAQNVLNAYSRIYQRKMNLFYYGLRLFADSSTKYFEVLNEFCTNVDSNSYFTEITVARKLMAAKDSFSYLNYMLLVADNDIPDYYKILIHTRAIRQFADNCEPFLNYGVFQSFLKNYSSTVQFLEEDKTCNSTSEQTEYRTIQYAYALFMSGKKEESLHYFRQLFVSDNTFIKQAAIYFATKILLEQGNNREGTDLKEMLLVSATASKYGTLALQLQAK